MMSKPKPRGGKDAADYYKRDLANARDEYYTKDMVVYDCWRGRLAERLGFSGQMTAEDFQNAVNEMDNILPNRKISKEINAKIDFYDMALTAPKSFSILLANPQYRDIAMKIFNDAIDETMAIMQREIGYRIRINGKDKIVYPGEIMQAKFIHYFSREGDLNLHAHIPTFNLIQDENGNFKAINSLDLFNNYMKWGLDFRRILAEKVQNEMNLGIVITNKEKGLWDINGYDDNLFLEEFSKRSLEIKQYLIENNLSDNAHNRQIACLATRKKKDDVDLVKTLENTQAIIDEKGYAPRELLNGRQYTDDDKYQIFLDALNETAGKEFAFDEDKVKERFLHFGVTAGCQKEDYEIMKERYGGFITVDEQKFFDKNKKKEIVKHTVTTQKNLDEAEYIRQHSIAGKSKTWGYNVKDMETRLADIEAKDKAEAEAKGESFYPLTEEQRRMLLSFLVSKNDDGRGDKYIAANGLAGTGKSFSFGRMVKVANSLGIEVIGGATGGSQSDELAKSTNISTDTIAGIIADTRKESARARGEKVDWKNPDGDYRGLPKAEKKTICVIDEAGQIPQHEMFELMKIAEARGDNFRVCFSGDWRQIHAVGAGTAYEDLIKSEIITKEELQEIYRQKGEIGKARSRGLSIGNRKPKRKSKKVLSKMTANERKKYEAEYNLKMKLYEQFKDPETTLNTMKDEIWKDEITGEERKMIEVYDDPETKKQAIVTDFCNRIQFDDEGEIKWMDGTKHYNLVLTATNYDKDSIDQMIHRRLLNEGKIGEEQEIIVDAKNKDHKDRRIVKMSIGERIVFRKNEERQEGKLDINVKNGTYGVIQDIDKKNNLVSIITDDGRLQKVDLNLYDNIEYGYSTTLDSSQGKTCHNTYYHFNQGDIISKNKLYVMATRTIKDQGTHIYVDDFEAFKKTALADDGKISAEEIKLKLENRKHTADLLKLSEDGIRAYKSPMERAEEYREKSGEIFINESLERTLEDIPKQLPSMETERDRAKEQHLIDMDKAKDTRNGLNKEYTSNLKKTGSFSKKLYINKADVEQIIDHIKTGSMTIPRDWKDIQVGLKYSEYMYLAERKTYKEIYRPKKLGGRTRRIPYARMSEVERKRREEKTWNSFNNDFKFKERYAKEIFNEVSRELVKIREREIPEKKKEKKKMKEFVMER